MATWHLCQQHTAKSKFSVFFILHVNFSNVANLMEYKKCYKTLGISEESDQEQIRSAFIKLAKKYHPDSGSKEANAAKFSKIDEAFRILINKKAKERWEVDEQEVQEQDIKHTAPQHRQYLSYEGFGAGTPFQREKEYLKFRATQAAQNVYNHRVSKAGAEEGALMVKAPIKHKIKTKYGFDRLVEDLIQESISKGEFSNLAGSGKPLPLHQNQNPYVDFVTYKLNEVLIDNGFTPEWITLQKEIREDVQSFRKNLADQRSFLGQFPLKAEEMSKWQYSLAKFEEIIEQINKKISKYNLVVPILDKQMIHIDLTKEGERILIKGEYGRKQINKEQITSQNNDRKIDTLFSLVDYLFKKE